VTRNFSLSDSSWFSSRAVLNPMDVPEFRTSILEMIAAENMTLITDSVTYRELRQMRECVNAFDVKVISSSRGFTGSE
jgi:hypothetical protein